MSQFTPQVTVHIRRKKKNLIVFSLAKTTDDVAIATIRTLAADMIAKSNSGHPGSSRSWNLMVLPKFILYSGAPLGMAPAAHILFSRRVSTGNAIDNMSLISHSFINANPKNSKWFNRDRFVLSNG
jgi:transketolase